MVRPRSFRRFASVTVFLGALLGAPADPATASTAQLVRLSVLSPCKYDPQCPPSPPPDTALVYLGGSEANRVTLAPGAQGVRISDPLAQIAPGPGCSRVDAHSVSCLQPTVLTYVGTGAGSDRVKSELGPMGRLTVDGGAGNDVLTGGAGPDALLGGPGVDRLYGRAGDDRLFDASSRGPLPPEVQSPTTGGSDVFFPAPRSPGRGRDQFDGGPGTDTLSYQGRRDNVRIDLATRARVSGARGEHDSVRGVENATGGGGADRIAGNRGANRLLGEVDQPGAPAGRNDRIAGRAGPDSIEGGMGSNTISGGPGNDKVKLGISGPDEVSCGTGTDSVESPLGNDFLAPDCERPLLTGLIGGVLEPPLLRSRLPLRTGRPANVLSGTLRCFLGNACQARLELRVQGRGSRRGTSPARGTVLGSQSVAIGTREVKSFDLGLSASGRRLLRRHRALRVRVFIASPVASPDEVGYLTLLRAP